MDYLLRRLVLFFILMSYHSFGVCDITLNFHNSTVSGSHRELINDQVLTAFGLHGDNLKRAVASRMGRTPDYAWVRSPTTGVSPDRYIHFSATPVHFTTTASFNRDFIETDRKTVIARDEYINNSSVVVNVNTTLTHQVRDVFEAQWNSEHGFSIGLGFNLKLIMPSLEYTFRFNESRKIERETMIGVSTTVVTPLQPYHSIGIDIEATIRRGETTITFPTTLSDTIYGYYKDPDYTHIDGRVNQNWRIAVGSVLSAHGLPSSRNVSLTVGDALYVQKRVLIYDLNSRKLLRSIDVPLGIQGVVTV